MSVEPLVDGQNDLLEDLLPILKNLIDATKDLSAKAAHIADQQRRLTTPNVESLHLANELLKTSMQSLVILANHGMDIAQHTSRRKV